MSRKEKIPTPESMKGLMRWHDTVLVDERSSVLRCLRCDKTWIADVKPNSGGNFYPKSWMCPQCGDGKNI